MLNPADFTKSRYNYVTVLAVLRAVTYVDIRSLKKAGKHCVAGENKSFKELNIKMCVECYTSQSRVTPLLKPIDCLKNHTQYICGTCGRCICIEHEPKHGLQRWNFPFKSLEIVKLYLRAADYTMKKPCGIYEIKDNRGKVSYKIFASSMQLQSFLQKNKGKICETMAPAFIMDKFIEYPNTQVRKLTADEIIKYMAER